MTTLAIHRDPSEGTAITLPPPRGGAISIRQAVLEDVAFIDSLQRKHAKMVGWFPTKQLEAYIAKGHVLIAEESGNAVRYCISCDRYFKRDDCGIVYQLNVTPGKQRGLIGASLIKAAFDRAAYGCKLFCCWCAQDLEANYFWESLGFVPLAFRTGARKAGAKKEPRIHIFWQRRIREGDAGSESGGTPYWFPAETTGGAVRENRLVLPIPPGTHWSDAKPAVLPGMDEALKALPAAGSEVEKKPREKKPKNIAPAPKRPTGGLWFAPAPGSPEALAAKNAEKVKQPKPPRIKYKNDPKLIAAVRELRDRYIEEINAGRMLPPSACGKYDVSRALEVAPSAMKVAPVAMLEAA